MKTNNIEYLKKCNNLERRKKLHGLQSVSELYRRQPLVGEASTNFWDRGCSMVSTTDPYGSILSFLHQSRYFFFQEAPQFYSRG
jgi:hypothetical protein